MTSYKHGPQMYTHTYVYNVHEYRHVIPKIHSAPPPSVLESRKLLVGRYLVSCRKPNHSDTKDKRADSYMSGGTPAVL